MKESLINSGLDEQSAKGKAYSNIYSVSNIYIYITPEGTFWNWQIFVWNVSRG